MLLPRGRKETEQPEVGPGFYPSVMQKLSVPEGSERWGVDPSYSVHSAEAMAKVRGVGRGKKSNLMVQVIPIYGFGILLYIIYIIHKLTCKSKTTKSGNCASVTKTHVENTRGETTDYELIKLQERLLQTEKMMERIVSGRNSGPGSGRRRRSKSTPSKKEEKLLRQLQQMTQVMQEGRVEGASPEMEAEEVPYGADWEGYPDETYPEYDSDPGVKRRFDTVAVEPLVNAPTAEALAERMEQEEEEMMARKLSIVHEEDEEEGEVVEEEEEEEAVEDMEVEEDEEEEEEEEEEAMERRQLLSPRLVRPAAQRSEERLGLEVSRELHSHNGGKKQISFSDHNNVFRYPREDASEGEEEEEEEEEEVEEEVGEEEEEEEEGTEVEEEEGDDDDPVMEAESLQFGCDGGPNPEEEAEEAHQEDYALMMSAPQEGGGGTELPKEVGVSGLRMRSRRET